MKSFSVLSKSIKPFFFLLLASVILFSCKKTSNAVEKTTQNTSVCLTAEQYLSYKINGTTYSYVLPVDSFKIKSVFEGGTFNNISYYTLSGYNILPTNNNTTFDFEKENISQGSSQGLARFICPQFIYAAFINPSIIVNITEYGNIGEYMSGNFTAVLPGMNSNGTLTGLSYNINCCFRIKRTV